MINIETQRLLLRPFEEKDLEDLYEYAKNPYVGPAAGWPPHTSVADSHSILNNFIEQGEVWALMLKEKNKVIGSLGLHKDQLRSATDVKMVGYVLSQDYWGLGLMPEAVKAVIESTFTTTDVAILTVHHYAHNLNSKRVIEKCGFRYEGTLRHCSQLFDQSVHDLVCYSITREEWEQGNH